MKIPLSWLKEYLDVDKPPREIAETLTLLGIEVDKVEPLPLDFTNVIVAKVITAVQHPNADRLKIATVFNGKETLQIVCGAPNCRPGIKVALAGIGATLKDHGGKTFKIKKGKMRDVESFGMLCGADELGLGTDASGILELDDHFVEGTDLADIYGDTIFEVSLTPNLGHCCSILGIARELAAKLKLPLKKIASPLKENSSLPASSLIQVEIEGKKECSRYGCRIIQGIKIGPSPDWLKRRIESCGVRSINNIVDIGNYVMLECGQPLHMFDYDSLHDKKLFVTSRTSFPTMTTLDGKLCDIPSHALLICDGEKPVAFAGVMGSEDSAVTDTTQNVLIEAAHFSPQAVRATAKKLNLHTDAAHRFERGTDPLAIPHALARAASLLQSISDGEIASGIVECIAEPFIPTKIKCRTSRVNRLLGTELSTSEMAGLLERLEIYAKLDDDVGFEATIPSYRNDLKMEIDLVEEIARLYSYDKIPLLPPRYSSSQISDAPLYLFEKKARALLLNNGLTELHTCDLISPFLSTLTKENSFGEEHLIHVLHPSSIEQSVLRASLLPGLLQAIKYNFDHQNLHISGFEIGRIHFKDKDRYVEPSMAAIIMTGSAIPYHFDPKPRDVDFFDLKGRVENFLNALGINNPIFEVSHLHNFHPGRQARVKIKDIYIGALGEVHPNHLRTLDIKQRVYFAEFNLLDLLPFAPKHLRITPLSLYPGSERDWTLTLEDTVPIDSILNAILAVPSKFLENVFLLDLYKSVQIGKDKKNATFRFFYRDKDKTISQETVEKEHARIIQIVEKIKSH